MKSWASFTGKVSESSRQIHWLHNTHHIPRSNQWWYYTYSMIPINGYIIPIISHYYIAQCSNFCWWNPLCFAEQRRVLQPKLCLRRVLWVDPEFNSGRLCRYMDVPCNTKVDILDAWCGMSGWQAMAILMMFFGGKSWAKNAYHWWVSIRIIDY